MAENIEIKQEIRESLFFLTLKLVILEFFFGIIFLFSTTVLDFFEINNQNNLNNIFSLEGLIMFTIIIVQIFLTIAVVIGWLYNYYELSAEKVTHHKGLFFLQKKSLYFREVQEITSRQKFLGRIFNYGNLMLVGSNTETLFSLQRIPQPQQHVEMLQSLMISVKRK
jgi:uncharacterized membrane protein YdbT with pleckstrin-like domain